MTEIKRNLGRQTGPAEKQLEQLLLQHMKISMQSWIPEKGSRWCASLPKAKIGDQSIYQICLKGLEGQILTVGSEIIQRWLTYCDGLLNTENTRKQIESGVVSTGMTDRNIQ